MTDLQQRLQNQKDRASFGFVMAVFILVAALWLLASAACVASIAAAFHTGAGILIGLIFLYFTAPVIFTPYVVIKNFVLWRHYMERHHRARFIDSDCFLGEDEAKLYRIVHDLSLKLGLRSVPAVALIPEEINAFAIGTKPTDSGVFLGAPLLEKMSWEQIEAVMAHELGHVYSRDVAASHMIDTVLRAVESILVAPLAKLSRLGMGAGANMAQSASMFWFVRGSGGLGLFGLALQLVFMMVMIPLLLFNWLLQVFFGLIQAVHSRKREFRADAVAALLTTPDAMVSALAGLERIIVPMKRSQDHLAYSKIVFKAVPERSAMELWGLFPDWFSSHPRTVDRIKALQDGVYLR